MAVLLYLSGANQILILAAFFVLDKWACDYNCALVTYEKNDSSLTLPNTSSKTGPLRDEPSREKSLAL
jgi:hypothetical protein